MHVAEGGVNAPVPGFVTVGDALRSALGALDVSCPRCNARPGENCKTVNGHPTFARAARSEALRAVRRAAA